MKKDQVKGEISYRSSRSSGAGGQNVNKVNTRIEAIWIPSVSEGVNAEEKQLIAAKLSAYINKSGELLVAAQDSRSQSANKEKATERLLKLLEMALIIPKARVKTKPSAKSKERKTEDKKRRAALKKNRSSHLLRNII